MSQHNTRRHSATEKGEKMSNSTVKITQNEIEKRTNLSKSSKQADPKYTCPDCKKQCRDGDKALECEVCERWFHADCQKVTGTMYEALRQDSEAGTNMLHWYCNSSCKFFTNKFMQGFQNLREDLDKVSGAVGNLTERVNKIENGEMSAQMETSIKAIVNEEIKGGSDAVQEGIQQIENFREIMHSQKMDSIEDKVRQIETINKFMDDKAKEQRYELEDRTRRQTNLIIFDLPESVEEEGAERKREDIENIEKILDEIGAECRPVFSKRLFKRRSKDVRSQSSQRRENDTGSRDDSDTRKATPILLKFKSKDERDEVLNRYISARKDAEEDEFEGEEERLYLKVKVKRDMTKQEREEDRALYSDIREKREQSKNEGDVYAKWVARNGRAVNIGRYPRPHYMRRGSQHM